MDGVRGDAVPLSVGDSNVVALVWESRTAAPPITAWTIEDHPRRLELDLGEAAVCDAFGWCMTVACATGIELSIFPLYIRPNVRTDGMVRAMARALEDRRRNEMADAELGRRRGWVFNFGPETHRMFRWIGVEREVVSVPAATVFEDGRGYGWFGRRDRRVRRPEAVGQGPHGTDSHVRIAPKGRFRVLTGPWRFMLRVSAEPAGTTGMTAVSDAKEWSVPFSASIRPSRPRVRRMVRAALVVAARKTIALSKCHNDTSWL